MRLFSSAVICFRRFSINMSALKKISFWKTWADGCDRKTKKIEEL